MTAHAIGSGGVKTVGAEESPGGVHGEDLAVKEHRHLIGIAGAEFHIMGYHDDGDTLVFQAAENVCQLFLKETIDTLGGFVQQKELGLG